MAKQHADRAKTHANVIVGSLCRSSHGGGVTGSDFTVAAMDALVWPRHQARHMDCDMHIDENQ
jgi:hypothetical protein